MFEFYVRIRSNHFLVARKESINDFVYRLRIAYDIRISRQAYSAYESGECKMPLNVFIAICDLLKIDWKKLLIEQLKLEIKEEESNVSFIETPG
jgi:transcriptional regulator with XRE-family HTH domain